MNTADTLRVMLVDDHEVVRRGLRHLLAAEPEFTIVAEHARIAGALEDVAVRRPDIVVLDLRLPDGDGLSLCANIKRSFPAVKVVVLTSYLEPVLMMRAIAAGVDGYVLKESEGTELAKALREVRAGASFFDPLARRRLSDPVPAPDRAADPQLFTALSGHEKRLLAQLTTGKTNREIGDQLHLSEKTIRNQLSELFAKLDVQNRTQAAAVYLRISAPFRERNS